MWLRTARGRLKFGRLPKGNAGSWPYPPRRGNILYCCKETTLNSKRILGEFLFERLAQLGRSASLFIICESMWLRRNVAQDVRVDIGYALRDILLH
jgi:hypothetical protein